jgi:23S rRNA (pseudouridine1915-N3)-methyltransferase
MIRVIAGGRKSRGWVAEAVAEYEKRLGRYWALAWRWVDDDKVDATVAGLGKSDFVIVLDERGRNLSSPELSEVLVDRIERAAGDIVFVIGGAYGVSDSTRERANLVWSLSRLVFPHEMVRVLLAEQIYRAQEIAHGSKYHHE